MKRNERNELRAQMAATILSGLVASPFVATDHYNPFKEDGKDSITDVAIVLADKLLQEIDAREEQGDT